MSLITMILLVSKAWEIKRIFVLLGCDPASLVVLSKVSRQGRGFNFSAGNV
jgi:hypothetical protein